MENRMAVKEKKLSPAKVVLIHLLLLVSAYLALLLRWALLTWSGLHLDDIVITLATSVKGTAANIIASMVHSCVVPALLVTGASAAVFLIVRNSGFRRFQFYAVLCLSLAALCVSGAVAYDRFEIASYMKSGYADFVDQNYVDPAGVSIRFPEKRNLIYIYMESMETSYADEASGGAFAFNCIPELTELARSGEDFSGPEAALNGGHVLFGATNTIKAMFAQSSGLPMKALENGITQVRSFFPNIVCLGDILRENGYTQELLMGSVAAFGGTKTLFTQHGGFRVLDYEYAQENGWIEPDYWVWWGYEDQKLFSFAKEELLRLSRESRPFNLTMVTIDTHFEDGYRCELCGDDFPDNPYANVMRCSSRQISAFVQWLREQDFYPDTTIVLVGDHLTMDTDFCENISPAYERRVFTAYINAAAAPKRNERREYSTFDFFPTTLAALGAEIQGDRLGLGTNLFSEEETLCERYGVAAQNAALA